MTGMLCKFATTGSFCSVSVFSLFSLLFVSSRLLSNVTFLLVGSSVLLLVSSLLTAVSMTGISSSCVNPSFSVSIFSFLSLVFVSSRLPWNVKVLLVRLSALLLLSSLLTAVFMRGFSSSFLSSSSSFFCSILSLFTSLFFTFCSVVVSTVDVLLLASMFAALVVTLL